MENQSIMSPPVVPAVFRLPGPPMAAALLAYLFLFADPIRLLAIDWWNDPDAGHGLLLAPLALWIAWKAGIRTDTRPRLALGAAMILFAVVARYVGGLAAEVFSMRAAALLAAMGLVVTQFGFRQLLHWWLPTMLLALSIPLPSVVISTLALPLQLQASKMGAALLEWRQVPVMLSGNLILLPGQRLFVTEACSGLRSLTALLSLSILIGGLWLKYPLARLSLVALAIPVAILINAVRVFLTGFLVYFVSPEMGNGFMHTTEGWLMFVVAFAALGALAWVASRAEATFANRRVG
jgi:exosortase